MPWNPDQYLTFQQQHFAPFDDLVQLVHGSKGMRVVDLGCGTGELTRRLADMLPNSDVLGVDASSEMLVRAQEQACPGLRFEQARIEDTDGHWDLIFSHAALQWVDEHSTLIPHLFDLLNPGGQLVVQQPSNHGHLAHRLIRQVAGENPFREELSGFQRESPVLSIDAYAELLWQAGGSDIVVYEKVYPHVLDNADAIADWVQGTALIPYMERLPESLHEPFMQRYRDGLRRHYPQSPLFYAFRRTLFATTRTAV